jgi:hypothetical protein
MNRVLVRYTLTEGIIAVVPVADGAEILGVNEMIIATMDNAKIMLSALGLDIQKLDEYTDPNPKIEE